MSERSTRYIEDRYSEFMAKGKVIIYDDDSPRFRELLEQRNQRYKKIPHERERSALKRCYITVKHLYMK